jgi:hypothetical protein
MSVHRHSLPSRVGFAEDSPPGLARMHGAYLAHLHTAVAAAHGPAGTRGSVIDAIMVSLAVLLVPCAIVLIAAIYTPGPGSGGGDDPDSGWGGGGGGGRPGPGGGPPQPETGPAWWPEFERQFAAYGEHAQYVERVVVTSQADGP